jgi:hypothetical protein
VLCLQCGSNNLPDAKVLSDHSTAQEKKTQETF